MLTYYKKKAFFSFPERSSRKSLKKGGSGSRLEPTNGSATLTDAHVTNLILFT